MLSFRLWCCLSHLSIFVEPDAFLAVETNGGVWAAARFRHTCDPRERSIDSVPPVLARVSSSWMMPQPVLVGFRECFHLSVAPALFQFHSLYNTLRRLIDLILILILSVSRNRISGSIEKMCGPSAFAKRQRSKPSGARR